MRCFEDENGVVSVPFRFLVRVNNSKRGGADTRMKKFSYKFPRDAKIALIGFFVLLTIAAAFATPIDEYNRDYFESRIFGMQDFYFANWTNTTDVITDVNDTRVYGGRAVKGLYFYTTELDPHMAMSTRVIDNNTFSVMVAENPDNPYPYTDVPVTLCSLDNNTIMNGQRFEVDNSPWCDNKDSTTIYIFPRLIFDRWFTVRFNEAPVNYKVWFGGDIISPQGGSSGLPVCTTVGALIGLNVTNSTIGEPFKMSGQGLQDLPGCSLDHIRMQHNTTTTPTYGLIPTTSTGIDANCSGVSCNWVTPPIDTWKRSNITCEKAGAHKYRVRVQYDVTGGPQNVVIFSPVSTHTCLAVVVPPSDDVAAWWVFALPFMMLVTTILISKKKRDKKQSDT